MAPFYDRVQLPQGYRATTRIKSTCYQTKFPDISTTHFIDLGKMKD